MAGYFFFFFQETSNNTKPNFKYRNFISLILAKISTVYDD